MFPRWRGYELLGKSSSQPRVSSYYWKEAAGYVLQRLHSVPHSVLSLAHRPPRIWQQKDNPHDGSIHYRVLPASCQLRRVFRRFCVFAAILPHILFIILVLCAVFFPSYTKTPAHYRILVERSSNSSIPGRANPHNEKIFIASSIYEPDGGLTGGVWGEAVLDLIDLLGPDNVFLSVYENDPTDAAAASLYAFQHEAQCKSSLSLEIAISLCVQVILPL